MTEDNMKSDIMTESKNRADGRQHLQRRRIPKNPSTKENGEYDPELALAIQESLKLAKQEAAIRDQKAKDAGTNVGLPLEGNANDTRKKVRSQNVESSEEFKHLKEWFLLHIDLIQQHQDVISQKDKEITGLKNENDALRCRLERMERRMSLLKQRDDGLHSPHTQSKASSPETASAVPPAKGFKRRQTFESRHLMKRLGLEDTNTISSITKPTPVKSSLPVPKLKQTIASPEGTQKKDKHSIVFTDSEAENSVIFKTDKLYYVPYYDQKTEPADDLDGPRMCMGKPSDIEVEVPSWRIRTVTNLYVMEGTENIEDETILNRHNRPEMEERRRKRWDLQRIREQRYYEKLRENELSHSKDDDNCMESFFPSLDDITHIEITSKVPVMAFGQPIPLVKTEEFSLPWEVEQSNTNKPPPHKRLRHI